MNGSEVLTCPRLPGRLNVEQAAVLLGFLPHDVPILVRAKLLKPLGNPAPNAPKYFPTHEVEEYAHDSEWLDKATKVISQHWRRKNERHRSGNGYRRIESL
jgi:hypothetical protein